MKTFKELLGYITAIGVIILGLAAGGVWLITPETTMKAEAKAPVVLQKFLDSNERKKPVSDDVVAPVRAAVPVMQESPASLPQQPVERRQTIREVSAPVPKAKMRQSASKPVPIEVPVVQPGRAASAPVSTARTDFPY